jgi:hypothetical protein
LPGFRKRLLEDLDMIKEEMRDFCQVEGMRAYKVMSTIDMLGIHLGMEEDEVSTLLGSDPVHLATAGYALMAEKLMAIVEDRMMLFQGEKRGREEDGEQQPEVSIGYPSRRSHEWLYVTVSGGGRWRGGWGGRGGRGGLQETRGDRGQAFQFGRGGQRWSK